MNLFSKLLKDRNLNPMLSLVLFVLVLVLLYLVYGRTRREGAGALLAVANIQNRPLPGPRKKSGPLSNRGRLSKFNSSKRQVNVQTVTPPGVITPVNSNQFESVFTNYQSLEGVRSAATPAATPAAPLKSYLATPARRDATVRFSAGVGVKPNNRGKFAPPPAPRSGFAAPGATPRPAAPAQQRGNAGRGAAAPAQQKGGAGADSRGAVAPPQKVAHKVRIPTRRPTWSRRSDGPKPKRSPEVIQRDWLDDLKTWTIF